MIMVKQNIKLPPAIEAEIDKRMLELIPPELCFEGDQTYDLAASKRYEVQEVITAYATKLHQANTYNELLKTEIKHLNAVIDSLKAQQGPVWVKANDRLPGWKKRVKWRDGNNHSYATDGEISLFEMEKPNLEGWEWLDESAAGREDAVALIKYIRENYKPSKEVWKDKFGIALLSDEGVLSMYKLQKEK